MDLGNDLPNAYRLDMALQNLVYKLVPNFFAKQLRKHLRKQQKSLINSQKNVQTSKSLKRRQNTTRNYLKLISRICNESEKISVVINYVPLSEVQGSNQKESTAKQYESEKCYFRRYFSCLAKVTLLQLKKLMEIKLAMAESYAVYFIDNSFVNLLDEELTLQDLVYIYSWNRKAPLNISFTIVRLNSEEDCPPILDIEIMPQLRPETPSQVDDRMDISINNKEISKESKSPKNVEELEHISPTLQIPQLHVSLPQSAFDPNGGSAIQPHSIIKTSTNNNSKSSENSKTSADSKTQRKRRKNSIPLKTEQQTQKKPNLITDLPSTSTTLTPTLTTVPENAANSSNQTINEYLNMTQLQTQQQKNSLVTVAQQLQLQRLSQSDLKEINEKNSPTDKKNSKVSISALKAKLEAKSAEIPIPPISSSLLPSYGTNPANSLAAYGNFSAFFQQQQLFQQNFNPLLFRSLLNPSMVASQQFMMNNANFMNNQQNAQFLNSIKKSTSKKAKISDKSKKSKKYVVETSTSNNNNQLIKQTTTTKSPNGFEQSPLASTSDSSSPTLNAKLSPKNTSIDLIYKQNNAIFSIVRSKAKLNSFMDGAVASKHTTTNSLTPTKSALAS